MVAVKGECKEVLFLCGKPTDDPLLHCVNIQGTNAVETFSFRRSEEQAAGICHTDTVGLYLYDPHAALRKAQCFHLPAQRYNLSMLAPNTHLYTSDERVPDFPGRTFKVLCEVPLNRKAVKEGLPDGKAHVVVRNFPAEAATLQKQLGLSEGGDLFVIATTVGTRRLGLLCQAV